MKGRDAMNNDELNDYILHYIEQDKTRRAIMLTAPWGTGKSFYIQHTLIPFLSSPKNGSYKCVVISLYGISNVSDISKAIYIETAWDTAISFTPTRLRGAVKKLKGSKSNAMGMLQVGAKSIIRGITSYFSVDLSPGKDSLTKLYKSVDLSKSLIILEDLERAELSVLEILGYVNNLTEQDGVKILLVANEDEVLSYELSPPDKEGKRQRKLDQESIQYLKIKEKTIEDTIYYRCDFCNAIKEIIGIFDNNNTLLNFKDEKSVKNILEIMYMKDNFNLRTFLFACQKTSDILSTIKKDNDSFNRNVFYSIIAFSMTIKDGLVPNWEGSSLVSLNFGLPSHPLY